MRHARLCQAFDLWSAAHSRAGTSLPAEWHGHKPVRLRQLGLPPTATPPVGADSLAQAHKILGSDVVASPKRSAWVGHRTWVLFDAASVAYFTTLHAGCLLAPATFSWPALMCFAVCLFLTGCVGITFSFHRNLSHKSFVMPKSLEYSAAYCGLLAAQGDPIEWVSNHRHHHMHCDTPGDPHTPYEGFWWSHVGWLLDRDATMARVKDRSNVADLASQRFYRWLGYTNILHVAGSAAVLFALGGLPFLVWGFCLRLVWVYHITWFVNSLAHVYGSQTYATGDLSRNNPLVALLAFGEGWHNNHHAFAFSARHGLEWWQLDVTWALIRALELLGLATKVKLPTESQRAKLRLAA